MYLPLYIVHGTKDLPEENSGVLIDRYEELNYDVKHEHPELGHNVWQTTYEDLKGAKWLLDAPAADAPARAPLQDAEHPLGATTRGSTSASSPRATPGARSSRASTRTTAIAAVDARNRALALDRDAERIDDAAPVTVGIDGRKLTFQAGEPHRAPQGGRGRGGPARPSHEGPFKHGTVTGPIRDVFHEPLLFVWGASDPAQARANEEVARAWARVRWGVQRRLPGHERRRVLRAGRAARERPRALPRRQREVQPRRARARAVVPDPRSTATTSWSATGASRRRTATADRSQLGAAFIRPNPRRPDRYVVVVEGVGAARHVALAVPAGHAPRLRRLRRGRRARRAASCSSAAGSCARGGSSANDWSVPVGPEARAVAGIAPPHRRAPHKPSSAPRAGHDYEGVAMSRAHRASLAAALVAVAVVARVRPSPAPTSTRSSSSSGDHPAVHLRGRAPSAPRLHGPLRRSGNFGVGFRGDRSHRQRLRPEHQRQRRHRLRHRRRHQRARLRSRRAAVELLALDALVGLRRARLALGSGDQTSSGPPSSRRSVPLHRPHRPHAARSGYPDFSLGVLVPAVARSSAVQSRRPVLAQNVPRPRRDVRGQTALHVPGDDPCLRRPCDDELDETRRRGKLLPARPGSSFARRFRHVREGKHGARSPKQAIAIGLSKARRAGVDLPPPEAGKTSEATRQRAKSDRARARSGAARRPSPRRARASLGALKHEGRSAASRKALSRQAKSAAAKRAPGDCAAASRKAARTKGPARRKAAAKKAARTRAAHAS